MRHLKQISKSRYLLCFFLIFFVAAYPTKLQAKIAYPDFRTSMLREGIDQPDDGKEEYRHQLFDSANPRYAELFKNLYEANIAEAQNMPEREDYRIPRIVHQIWLGGKVPEEFAEWMQTWMAMEGWEYRLWTDEDAKKMNLYNRELFNSTKSFVEKADIVRLEILHRYGGLYVDVDFECLNPEIFNELNKCFDFYIGFEPLEHGRIERLNMFKFCNALIGAVPRHPLIKDLIENMQANYFAYRPFKGVIERTGPSYFTRLICAYVEKDFGMCKNMYLPSTFFYPITELQIENLYALPNPKFEFLPETAGIHWWSGTWRKNKGLLHNQEKIN